MDDTATGKGQPAQRFRGVTAQNGAQLIAAYLLAQHGIHLCVTWHAYTGREDSQENVQAADGNKHGSLKISRIMQDIAGRLNYPTELGQGKEKIAAQTRRYLIIFGRFSHSLRHW